MNAPEKNLSLLGEVVETFDNQGKRTAKIRLHSQFVEAALEDAHLGDKVIIEAVLSINNVRPAFSNTGKDD